MTNPTKPNTEVSPAGLQDMRDRQLLAFANRHKMNARWLREAYNAYVAEGFTDEQAWHFVKAIPQI